MKVCTRMLTEHDTGITNLARQLETEGAEKVDVLLMKLCLLLAMMAFTSIPCPATNHPSVSRNMFTVG